MPKPGTKKPGDGFDQGVFTPNVVFAIYLAGSAAAILAFRMIFPGEGAPLACFSVPWRVLRAGLTLLDLFPALALSGIILPFAVSPWPEGGFGRFSPRFLKIIRVSVMTAIAAACVYGLLFFLAAPAARDREANLVARGRLYRLAKAEAQRHAAADEWVDASRYLEICETIWPDSPELAAFRIETTIRAEAEAMHEDDDWIWPVDVDRPLPGLPGEDPLDAAEALALAETAMLEERYFDAHWLATVAGRLAKPGSHETTLAGRLASRAWNAVSALEPTAREGRAYALYRLKREGYGAMVAEDWIRAYYLFQRLVEETPEDPDAARYFALSRAETGRVAFFLDEMEMTPGTALVDALFSLPLAGSLAGSLAGPPADGRLALRFGSLSVGTDNAYGTGVELQAYDADGKPLWSAEAPYAKLLPLSLDAGPRGGGSRVELLLRALDREDGAQLWEPRWDEPGGGDDRSLPAEAVAGAKLSLDLTWNDFLLLLDIRGGQAGMETGALIRAAALAPRCGYAPQVFQAEIIRRFAEPGLFLIAALFAIVAGWRYRALKRPRVLGVPMMFVLPLVLSGVVQVLRACLSTLAVWGVVSLGFVPAAAAFGILAALLFIFSLVVLAAQHG